MVLNGVAKKKERKKEREEHDPIYLFRLLFSQTRIHEKLAFFSSFYVFTFHIKGQKTAKGNLKYFVVKTKSSSKY